ncbi:hypothetical protein ALC53_08577 [Atta colombica]|uniref:Uncharacterized protein n=1 Tax=Atta colombica TaxID=520822 RepID=A0A151I2L4_9HYME|nr:hypothetical protein ALC53_08577 [Atta colombica]
MWEYSRRRSIRRNAPGRASVIPFENAATPTMEIAAALIRGESNSNRLRNEVILTLKQHFIQRINADPDRTVAEVDCREVGELEKLNEMLEISQDDY